MLRVALSASVFVSALFGCGARTNLFLGTTSAGVDSGLITRDAGTEAGAGVDAGARTDAGVGADGGLSCQPAFLERRARASRTVSKFPSTIGHSRHAARGSVARGRRPNRTDRAWRRAARRIRSVPPERTAAAFPSRGSRGLADARTTSASPIRIVHRGRRACAAPRLPTTARRRALWAEIAPSTRTAGQAGIARRRRLAPFTVRRAIIATLH